MRFVLCSAAGFALFTVFLAAGCSAGIAAPGDGGLGDGSSPNGDGGLTDGFVVEGSTGSDSGLACGQLGGGDYANSKACTTANDCTTVARGCYCGAQPVIGIAKSFATAAQACEAKAGSECGLGCPNAPGHTAEDGKNDVDGGAIEVLCDVGKCHTVLR